MVPPVKSWRKVSQAPIKFTNCYGGCGAQVEYRTNPRVYCPPCKLKKVRASARTAMEKRRRDLGIPRVKGLERVCADCGLTFTLCRNLNAKRCANCGHEAMKERSRERSTRLARDRGAVEAGSNAECRRCGASFKVAGSRNYLCPPCGAKSVRMEFPDQAEKKRKYLKGWQQSPNGRDRMTGYQKRSRNKRKANPAFTINERMSAGIRGSLVNGKQGSSWEQLVGYTLADLMRHIERGFQKGMTWENRGSWHLDHVRPVSSFNFDSPSHPEFLECWCLQNLRPLWAEDNLTKRDKRTHLI